MKAAVKKEWGILLVLVLAFALRLPLLNGSFWLDEAAQALESARPLTQQLQIVDDFQPPLLHVLVHFLLIVSKEEWWLRFGAAVVPGIITIWATYRIGTVLFTKKAGIIAALFLATSSFHVYFSQELRQYSFPAMLAALSWLLIFEADKLKPKKLVAFILLSIAGLFTSYLYPFLLISQLLFMVLHRPHMRKASVLTVLSCIVAGIPWLPTFLAQLHAGQVVQQRLPGWRDVVSFNQLKSLILVCTKFVFGVVHIDTHFFSLALLTGWAMIFALLAASIISAQRKRKIMNRNIHWLLLWFIFPILTAWLFSFVIPVIQPKRVLFCLPALALLLGYFCTQIKNRTLTTLVLVLLLIVNMASTFAYFTTPAYQREDWRGMHQLIRDKYSPNTSVVLFAFPEAFAPWRWYDDGTYPVINSGVFSVSNATDLSALKKATAYQHILVFDYLQDLTDPQRRMIAELHRYGYVEVEQLTPKTQLGIVRVFSPKQMTLGERIVP